MGANVTLNRAAFSQFFRLRLRHALTSRNLQVPYCTWDEPASPYLQDITLTQTNGRIGMALPAKSSTIALSARRAVVSYIYLLSHCPPDVRRLTGNCSDGNEASAARFAPSS